MLCVSSTSGPRYEQAEGSSALGLPIGCPNGQTFVPVYSTVLFLYRIQSTISLVPARKRKKTAGDQNAIALD
jgi:hypothetical protein